MVKIDADTIQPGLFINLNSNQADISISSSNKIFKLNNIVEALDGNQIVVTLWDAIVPNSIYNVNQYYSTFVYNDGSTDKTVTLPYGYYDSDLIVSSLQAFMRGSAYYNSTGVVVTLSSLTGKLGIDVGSGRTIRIVGGTLLQRLGLQVTSSDSQSVIGDGMLNVVGSPFLQVRFNNISTNNLDSQGHRNDILGCVPIDDAFGSWVHYNDSGGRHNILSTRFITSLHIEITDTEGHPVDFNGLDWKLTLSVHFIKERTHDFKRIEFE